LKILFLYTELAGYFVSCLHELSKQVEEIHIVRWPVNKEAPFQFEFPENVVIYERERYTSYELVALARSIKPDQIFCSGWIDKGYLKVCIAHKGKIPTVMSMDNHWNGSFRQRLMQLIAPWVIHRRFSHAWVPGMSQKAYALKLHFNEQRIKTGFYSADTIHFSAISQKLQSDKQENFPKRFLYVGRYIEVKGIFTLWNAFIRAVEQTNSSWELWCLGTGKLFNQRAEHSLIKHFGFVQPSEMESVIAQTGVFVLPSTFEPWGVAVHEMAAAGMPMLCSDKVGAATQFLQNGLNGFLFPTGNEEELTKLFVSIMQADDKTLLQMAKHGEQLAQQITPKIWAETALSFTI